MPPRSPLAMTPSDMLLTRVLVQDGCWEWTGWHNTKGYARVQIDGDHQGVHRVIYELVIGPIPAGMTLDHLCRNTACVNPWHLEPVSLSENVRRQHAARTHCKRGHAFTPENTRHRPQGRVCITCQNAWAREKRARLKTTIEEGQ
jgi:hypothetical protein